jgi:nitrogen fixation protein FixH
MQEKQTTRLSWNPWPISIIAFFTVAIIGCGSFIAFCSRHPADLVASDYYEQEVRYQGQIDRLQHAQQPAASTTVTYNTKSKVISIALPTNYSQSKPSGSIQLYRPSATNLDRQFKLAPDDQGVQTIDASSLLPGLWKVRVSWTADKKEFYLDQKIVIGEKTS